MHHILIIEDDKTIREGLCHLLEKNDFKVSEANSVEQAIENLDIDALDVIITDLRLPGKPGTDLIRMTPTPVLVLTTYTSQRSATDSLNRSPADSINIGTVDYISLPFDQDEIFTAINRVLSENIKEKKRACLNPRPTEKPIAGMSGKCPAMAEMFRRIRKIAQTNSPVLIQGESGTGKELVAQALHEGSTRKDASLISINCAAIPKNLIESELFGHEKDAFPGATSTRQGMVEAANNGTLFLDEIGELPLEAQARLLRVIEEQEIRKVGSVQSQKVDIRLVAATCKDLKQFVEEGLFREDLFYRINVMPLQIPPLRERGVDIIELADKKLSLCCERLNVPQKTFSANAIQVITTYPWPGNVRELENAIERAVIMTEHETIPMDLLGLDVELVRIDQPAPANSPDANTAKENGTQGNNDTQTEELSLKDYFQRFVLEHQNQLNETELAKKLGISRKCLWERRQRFNIPRKKNTA
ncbi:MAG: sigma-54-dependent Fis family transcriptional regulator [Gammaproteobacteria bacterium]|jgi:DNA-binding NtrC family response regulator|nr:sigma-54-dependent Fis family transcriptional regulator [Gammaproteobacteria bacterium]